MENNFLIGLSLDGIKATHDAFRKDTSGQETYLKVLNTAELFRRTNVTFNILTVVNGKTAPKIGKIYDRYRQLGFEWQQYIACLEPMGKVQGKMEYSLLPKVYGQFLIDLFERWEIDFEKGEQPYIRQFENYIDILSSQVPEACEQRGICGIQTVIEADGSVYPCDFYVMDEYRLGNINESDFSAFGERRKQIGFMERSYNHTETCKKCEYFFICRGGCNRHREQPGTVYGENYFCSSYKMFFDACLPKLQRIVSGIR